MEYSTEEVELWNRHSLVMAAFALLILCAYSFLALAASPIRAKTQGETEDCEGCAMSEMNKWMALVSVQFDSIGNKGTFELLFDFAKSKILDNPLDFEMRRQYLATLHYALEARMRFLVPPVAGASGIPYKRDFTKSKHCDLLELFERWLDFLGLCNQNQRRKYCKPTFPALVSEIVHRKETSKTFIYVLLQLDLNGIFFDSEMVEQWKAILGDGNPQKAVSDALYQCTRMVKLKRFAVARQKFNIYIRLCSDKESVQHALLVTIHAGWALQTISDRKRIADVFCVARNVLSKQDTALLERENCLRLLYNVILARIKYLSSTASHEDGGNGSSKLDLPNSSSASSEILEEMIALWRNFLAICSNVSHEYYAEVAKLSMYPLLAGMRSNDASLQG
jgi:hypothetical protein